MHRADAALAIPRPRKKAAIARKTGGGRLVSGTRGRQSEPRAH